MKPNKIYSVIEDMSPDGKLTVFMQEDGDVLLRINSPSKEEAATVEFCGYGGGGKSPKVREALIKLADAIEETNLPVAPSQAVEPKSKCCNADSGLDEGNLWCVACGGPFEPMAPAPQKCLTGDKNCECRVCQIDIQNAPKAQADHELMPHFNQSGEDMFECRKCESIAHRKYFEKWPCLPPAQPETKAPQEREAICLNADSEIMRGEKVDKKSAVAQLWTLLDDIDTASDMFKPSSLKGYENFYKYAMKKVAERFNHLTSDGYELYLPEARKERES